MNFNFRVLFYLFVLVRNSMYKYLNWKYTYEKWIRLINKIFKLLYNIL